MSISTPPWNSTFGFSDTTMHWLPPMSTVILQSPLLALSLAVLRVLSPTNWHLPFAPMGLPCWLSGRGSTCQCRRCRFGPWVGKIPLEKRKVTHSSNLAWQLQATEEPGGLQPIRSQESQTHWAMTALHLSKDRTKRRCSCWPSTPPDELRAALRNEAPELREKLAERVFTQTSSRNDFMNVILASPRILKSTKILLGKVRS